MVLVSQKYTVFFTTEENANNEKKKKKIQRNEISLFYRYITTLVIGQKFLSSGYSQWIQIYPKQCYNL